MTDERKPCPSKSPESNVPCEEKEGHVKSHWGYLGSLVIYWPNSQEKRTVH